VGVESRFLEWRFLRRLQWKEDETGRVLVFRPRFGEVKLGQWFRDTLKLSDYRIRLDEIGTLVWKACDGETTAAQIVERMRREFGDAVEPAEERLHNFILKMKRARLIEIEAG
jgi:hypothetical protein